MNAVLLTCYTFTLSKVIVIRITLHEYGNLTFFVRRVSMEPNPIFCGSSVSMEPNLIFCVCSMSMQPF